MKQKSRSSCGRAGLANMGRDHPASIQAFLLLSCVQKWHHSGHEHLCVWVTLGRCGCWCLVKSLAAVEGHEHRGDGELLHMCAWHAVQGPPGTRLLHEGVEDKVDKANLEQCNLRFKYQDANKACFSFPPPNDCGSLSCHDPCTKIWSLHGLARFLPSVWLP